MDEKNKLPVALCYFLIVFWPIPLIIWLIKKDVSETVAFLCLQALVFSAMIGVLSLGVGIFSIFPILGALVALGWMLVFLGVWVYGIVLGIQIMNKGEEPELPIIGDFTRNSLM